MKFKFKISNKIKEAWELYKQNIGLFILMFAVLFVLQVIATKRVLVFYIISILLSIFIGYMIKRFLLNIVDRKEFDPFSKKSLPSKIMFWNFIKTYFLYVLIFIGGILILMLPSLFFLLRGGIIYWTSIFIVWFIVILLVGTYFSVRLSFSLYISVDKNYGAKKSIKESWNLTKNHFWFIFGKMLVIGLFAIVGLLAFGVGFLITYPISMILIVMLYRDLNKFKEGNISYFVEEKIEEIKEKAEEIKENIEEKIEEVKEKVEGVIN